MCSASLNVGMGVANGTPVLLLRAEHQRAGQNAGAPGGGRIAPSGNGRKPG